MADKEQAAFESTTKGFGKKLLLKMGWKEGSGLGKEGEGIVKPIEVNLRSKGTGLGFFDEPDSKVAHQRLYEKEVDKGMTEEVGPYERPWKKAHKAGRKGGEEDNYEMVGFSAATTIASGPVQIIDMTGRGSTTNYQSHDALDQSSPFPELVQAIRRISLRSQNQLRQLESSSVAQGKEIKERQLEMDNCKDTVKQLEIELEWKRAVQELVQRAKLLSGLLRNSLLNEEEQEGSDSIVEQWRGLFKIGDQLERFNRERQSMDVIKIALSMFSDPVRIMISQWNPLAEPDDLAEIIHVLSGYEFKTAGNETIDIAHQLMLKFWMPAVRSYLVNSFDPRDEQCASFVARWSPLMKAEVRTVLMDMIIVKRIEETLGNGRLDELAGWLPNWIPILDGGYADLIAAARRRVTKYLDGIKLSEAKAQIVLWKSVFPQSESERLIVRAILPKLSAYLDRNFVIDPSNQDIDPLMEVLEWSDIIPADFMVDLVKTGLFRKLRITLHAWITSADADFGEITEWYEAWKSVLPDDMKGHPVVEQEFTYLLVMMEALLEDPSLPLSRFL